MIDLVFDIGLKQGDFTLNVRESSRVEVLGLFGPSGAGKTTMLEAIAGLRTPERGEIRIGGRTLFDSAHGLDLPSRHRHIGYVPQDVLLFPHLDVRGNLEYGLRSRNRETPPAGAPGRGRETNGGGRGEGVRFDQCVDILGIGPLLGRRVPGLSGGERQRVAIGRALMTAPALLLLDEPLAAIDRARRERILPYLLRIRRELHVPLLYVTHDRTELTQIADRVLLLEDGKILRAEPSTR